MSINLGYKFNEIISADIFSQRVPTFSKRESRSISSSFCEITAPFKRHMNKRNMECDRKSIKMIAEINSHWLTRSFLKLVFQKIEAVFSFTYKKQYEKRETREWYYWKSNLRNAAFLNDKARKRNVQQKGRISPGNPTKKVTSLWGQWMVFSLIFLQEGGVVPLSRSNLQKRQHVGSRAAWDPDISPVN